MVSVLWTRSSASPVTDSTSESTTISNTDINVPAYFSVLALSLVLAEIISKSPKDLRICRSVQGSVFSNCAFIFARLATVGYLVALIILQTAPLHQCSGAYQASSAFYTLSVTFTLFLIYDRLRLSYPSLSSSHWRSWLVPVVFTLLGVAIFLACALTLVIDIPFTGRLTAINITQTSPYCVLITSNIPSSFQPTRTSVSPAPYAAVFLAVPLLNTALVFMLVAARQVDAYAHAFWTAPIGSLGQFLGDCWEIVKAGLIDNAQVYYLVSTITQLITLILFLLGQSTTARVFLLPVNLVLLSIASGRGYIHVQEQRAMVEHARRSKVFRTLGFESNESTADQVAFRSPSEEAPPASPCVELSSTSMDMLGGIKVTKTVVQTSE